MRRAALAAFVLALAAAAASPSLSLPPPLVVNDDGGDVPSVTASGYASAGEGRGKLFYVYYEAEGGATAGTPILIWLEVKREREER